MLDEIDPARARLRPVPRPDAGGALDELAGRLAARRVTVRRLSCAAGTTAGGVTLSVAVSELGENLHARDRFLARVCELARDGVPVTLTLQSLGEGDAAIGSLEDFCAALKRALVRERLTGRAVGLALASQVMPLQMFLLVCTALLGDGPRFTLLDGAQMRHHDDRQRQEEVDQNWSFLWRRRRARSPLLPTYATGVTTRCPLLHDEAATSVLPEFAVRVPATSAWLPLEIGLTDFSNGRGRLDWERLQIALRACIDLGDRVLDHLVWPEARQRQDACLNRRLAVIVGGIGDLVVEYGAAPGDLSTLQWADRLMLRISRTLWSRSQALAKKTGVLPALTHADPTAGSRGMARRGDWRQRWQDAVARSAVRHRSLLVMSPYAVLPSGDHHASDFIDLLPALHHADAFSFSGPVSHGCRDADEYAAFHRRAFAVIERRNAASLVAAGA